MRSLPSRAHAHAASSTIQCLNSFLKPPARYIHTNRHFHSSSAPALNCILTLRSTGNRLYSSVSVPQVGQHGQGRSQVQAVALKLVGPSACFYSRYAWPFCVLKCEIVTLWAAQGIDVSCRRLSHTPHQDVSRLSMQHWSQLTSPPDICSRSVWVSTKVSAMLTCCSCRATAAWLTLTTSLVPAQF